MSFLFGRTSSDLIDNFEDGDIAEYTGAKSPFSVQSNTVFDGNNALKGVATTKTSSIISTAGLDNYPAQGDTFEVYQRDGRKIGLGGALFGVQDINNFYLVQFNSNAQDLRFFVKDGGSFTRLASQSTTISADVWYRLEIDWGSTITVSQFDGGTLEASVSVTDSTYTSGGIGFRLAVLSNSQTINSFWDLYRLI